MRLIIICLAALLVLIQFPLWLGKGGWLRAWDLDKQVVTAQKRNDDLKARNAKLSSEVQDLKEGTGAVEERARYELGMIKESEIFVQILAPNTMPPSEVQASPPATPVRPKPATPKPKTPAKPAASPPVRQQP